MTTTDRRDATDAQFADELARLDRLDVADIAADVREREMELADEEGVDYCQILIAAATQCGDPVAEAGRCWEHYALFLETIAEILRDERDAAIAALKPAPGTDTSTEDALHRVLDLADQWESDAARADDAEPATRDDLSRMISASRWSRQHAAEVRAAISGDQS